MPKKDEKMSIEHKEKIASAHKGVKRKPFSLECRNNMRLSHLGKHHPNKSHKQTEDTKQKIRESKINIPRSEETKCKLRLIKGDKHWGYKKKRPLETRIKMSETRKGEKHWNWQGGLTTINSIIRKSIEYKLWRESVYIRDNYTCQICGQIGGKLNVDHIKSFSKFPELRLAIDNGRTLCITCHRKTPNYGRPTKV